MTVLRTDSDQDVLAAVEAAAQAACTELDALFPGCEKGGITSNFQGLLVDVLTHMIKGRSVLDGVRGFNTTLPTLVVDNNFVGSPLERSPAGAYLPIKIGAPRWDYSSGSAKRLPDEVFALCPDTLTFRPIQEVGDAWTQFDAAASAVFDYFRRNEMTLEQATAENVYIRPVAPDATRETGYLVATTIARAV